MNIRDLSYITALAKTGHFGQAAERCNVSQPGLSTQIKKLEQELGVTLFERDNRSVRLTHVGEEIVALATQALTVVDKIYHTAGTMNDPLGGKFRLGAIPTIAPYLIPELMSRTQTALPDLQLQFREDITENLNEALIDGEVDAAILATPPENARLAAIELYDEPFWVLYPANHALGQIKVIKTQELPFDELLLLSEGHCFRDQAIDVCRLDAVQENHSIRATSLETLVNMVLAGQGVTLLPASALEGGWANSPDIHKDLLDDPRAYRRVYLTYRRSSSRSVLLRRLGHIICENLPNTLKRVD